MEPEPGNAQRRWSDNSSFSTELDSAPKAAQFAPQPTVNGVNPLFPWDRGDRKVEISGPRLGDHLGVPNQQSSAGSRSSVVNDGGNAKYLAGNKTSSRATFSTGSRADELGHVGAGVGDTTEHPEFSEADFDQDEALPQDEVEREDSEDQLKELENLGVSIRTALIPVVQEGERKKFLPNDARDRIITRKRVRQELSRHMVVPPEELDTLTDEIWEITTPSPSKSPGRETTRRKIFAILGLMDKVKDITDFIQGKLHDNDLPFELLDGPRPLLRLSGKGRDGSAGCIPLFDKWRAHELESFNNYQWELIAPYFELITETNRKVLHYNLQNRIILPFVEDVERAGRAGGRAEGGYGEVWRVKIHPAHHNAATHKNPSYAVKRLRHSDQEAFDAEVSNLKRFTKSDHLHLIKLLVTYKWREKFYLLFPWADGNLLDFWQRLPQPSDPERNYDLALWFSKQCLGIAQGLKMIHTADIPSKSVNAALSEPNYPNHGRHGDLKPENILWFKSYKNTEDSWRGVLKISDFGLTSFHRTQSLSHFENVPVSPTYRAPEFDVAFKTSQSYDVWTLGCVLLEFVTWYLLGWEEVDKFSKERTRDDRRDIPEDVFFNFVKIREQDGGILMGARAKLSVANEFQTLYEHRNCSDFILDLLTFIKDKLLRIAPNNRAKCCEIVEKFEELNNNCVTDQGYCMKRLKKTPERTGTALSELTAAALCLSAQQTNRIQRNHLPEHLGPVEDDYSLNNSPDYQSFASGLDDEPPTKFSPAEGVQVDRKGKTVERIDKLPPVEFSSLLHKNDAQTTPSDHGSIETQKASPQSPKRVHFGNGEQQPSEPEAYEQGKDFPRMQDQPLDKAGQNEKQGKVTMGYAVPPSNSSTDDGPKATTSVDNDGIQNSSLHNPRPEDLGVDSPDESTRIEHNNGASGGEGSLEGANPEPQEQNIPTVEQPNAPETQPQNKILRAAAAPETRPRGVKRFLWSLCCRGSGD